MISFQTFLASIAQLVDLNVTFKKMIPNVGRSQEGTQTMWGESISHQSVRTELAHAMSETMSLHKTRSKRKHMHALCSAIVSCFPGECRLATTMQAQLKMNN